MTLNEIAEIIDKTKSKNYHLYFITRTKKKELKGKAYRKSLNKYNYTTYSVNINDDLREYFCNLTKRQIKESVERDLELVDYDIISDDTDKVLSYTDISKISGFMSVVNDQLAVRDNIRPMGKISSLIESGSLWAYCLEIEYMDEEMRKYKKIQAFRKISSGKVVVDRNSERGFFNTINTYFNDNSCKLEILHGDTIKLDKKIDCIFIEDSFYVLNKRPFEQMVGLEELFKEKAEETVTEIASSGILKSTEFLSSEVANNTAIHKRLVKIQTLGLPQSLNKTTIDRMKKAAQYEGKTLRSEGYQFLLENKEDLEVVLKVLCDYYKTGIITRIPYGTFAGKKLIKRNQESS